MNLRIKKSSKRLKGASSDDCAYRLIAQMGNTLLISIYRKDSVSRSGSSQKVLEKPEPTKAIALTCRLSCGPVIRYEPINI